jgi:hypothetical protein
MTKGKAALPGTAAKGTLDREEGGVLVSAYLATTIYRSVTLPFVIQRACDFFDLLVFFDSARCFSIPPERRHPERSASSI